MNCMKCGNELKTSGVFCPSCLEDMDQYPIKPNITVHLPARTEAPAARKRQRRARSIKPEDQIRHLKKVRNVLATLLFLTALAFFAVSAMLLHELDATGEDFGIGQNYDTVDTNETE